MADGSCIERRMNWSDWVRLTSAPTRASAPSSELRIVDLFSGCGGMSLGAWEAARRLNRELRVRLAVDVNGNALDVYRANLADADSILLGSDVNLVFGQVGAKSRPREVTELVEQIGCVDVLLAGPPCQGNSDLNNRSRRRDPRNELYLSAIHAVELLRPKLAIIENVPGVVHDVGGVIEKAHALLRELGYRVCPILAEFNDYGVPQLRRRHVTIASKVLSQGELLAMCQPTSNHRYALRDFIEGLEDEPISKSGAFFAAGDPSPKNRERINWLFDNNKFDLPDEMRPACHSEKAHSYRSMYGRMYWDRPAQTITSGFGSMGQGRYVHPLRRRTLTCHEAARIQGFPDFFRFEASRKTDLREMIGNAVPPQFCATIVEAAFGKISALDV
jgi:DNA (cytosine-5)-methyltransferase 1